MDSVDFFFFFFLLFPVGFWESSLTLLDPLFLFYFILRGLFIPIKKHTPPVSPYLFLHNLTIPLQVVGS